MALSRCIGETDGQGRELLDHGTALFPAACYHDDLEKGEVPWHWHDEIETTVVEGGAAVVSVGGESYVVQPGDGFFISAGALHGMWPAGPGPCRLRAVLFHPRLVGGGMDSIFWQRYLQPLLSDPCRQCVCFSREVPWEREALQAVEEAWQACAGEPPGYEFRMREELSREVFLLSQHRPAVQTPPSEKALRDTERIKIMLQYIQEHCGEELTTAKIARSAAVSESECLRCFRAMVGTTPIQYVKQLRIQRAAELLASTERRIADIGAACGFQEMSYFAKTFRTLKGKTPSAYRAAAREGGIAPSAAPELP